MTAISVPGPRATGDRLETWKQLGLPNTGIEVDISTIRWEKPIFGDEAVIIEQVA